jgi:catalase
MFTLRGRRIGCLISDGVDGGLVQALRTSVQEQGGAVEIIAPHVGGVKTDQHDWIAADQQLAGGPSVLYDAVVIALAGDAVDLLCREATARDFVADAYAHLKYIGFTSAAIPLLAAAGVPEGGDEGVVELTGPSSLRDFLERATKLRLWSRESRVRLIFYSQRLLVGKKAFGISDRFWVMAEM